MDINQEFKSVKSLVLFILEHYPETRSNDNKLFVKCAEVFGAKTLKDLEDINLNLISVYKVRQLIQNKENKFLPDLKVIENRKKRQSEIHDFVKAN
jgi:hypothetical protein